MQQQATALKQARTCQTIWCSEWRDSSDHRLIVAKAVLVHAPSFQSDGAGTALRSFFRSGEVDDPRPALLTLNKMAQGGIYDHLGGGFARYSTDDKWLVPHFEKCSTITLLVRLYAGQGAARRAGVKTCWRSGISA